MPQLFLDLDGVLADFDTYAEGVFGLPPRRFEDQRGTKRFWADLKSHEGFYNKLPLMADALELYEAVAHLKPTILTGLPVGDWAEPQKRAWCGRHFPVVPVICCPSKDKRNHMRPGDIIVDDWPKYKSLWEEAGGIFIVHTSAATSLAALREIGVLPCT